MNPALAEARFLMERSRYDRALRELEIAIQADPKNAQAHGLAALAQLAQHEHDAAHGSARRAVFFDPENDFAHYSMARVQFAMGQSKQAEQSIREAISRAAHPAEYWGYLAGIYYERRRWKDALAAAEQGLAADPEQHFCRNIQSLCLGRLGRKGQADATRAEVLQAHPENALSHASRAWAFLEAGRKEQALEGFRDALRLNPSLDWARMGLMEVLKARHPVYSILLRWFHAMAGMQAWQKWLVVLGIFLVNHLLNTLAHVEPAWKPWIYPLNGLYLVMVFLTWAGGPLFNLLLWLDPFGRHVLTDEEKAAGKWLGLLLAAGTSFLVSGLLLDTTVLVMAGAGALTFIIPLGGTYSIRSGRVRTVVGSYALFLGIMLLAGLAVAISDQYAFNLFSGIYLAGVLAFGWVANLLGS